ncbi:MAG: hypothetical protein DCF28_05805 [Alphaproteobacteria bacterium]|nr:MAG: hypothetical protein DCF28_05805 [Alphaproteobacteria bacterium]PZO40099.1 MAG: hypothetical protein DCE92_03225 [Alphaproteobacteria bacterium]
MPMKSLRMALLGFVAPLALATTTLAQEAQPPAPAITPGVLTVPDVQTIPAAAPATPAVVPIPEVWAPVPRNSQGRTAYGLYLAGRSALANGEGSRGAAYLAEVSRLTPEQPSVRQQTFMASLISGDLDDAARTAPAGDGVSPVIGEAGRLVSVIQTFAQGDARDALSSLKARPIQPPHALGATLVTPWIAAEAGDWDLALADPAPGSSAEVGQLQRYNQAQLLEIRRRHDEADAAFKALVALAPTQTIFRIEYGAFLERRGRREDALALYAAAPDAGRRTIFAPVIARAGARGRPPKLTTIREGAADALNNSAAVLGGVGLGEFAAVYIRMALSVAPSDGLRMKLGEALTEARLTSAARAAYADVSQDDPLVYAIARTQIGLSFAQDDKFEEALGEYEKALAAMPDNPGLAQQVAGMLLQLQRYDESLAILNAPVLARAGQGAETHFLRGAAYESLGRMPEAEAELWAALQLQPNNPTILNYLGYLWVDSGTRVAEGAAMIARAHAAAPNDGNIQDSLGWAQFRQGQYEIAVSTLEDAVAKEPANAEINDHLGDAYWQVGRQREAGFQWNRVLTLDPDAERKAGVEKKLVEGLGPLTPVSAETESAETTSGAAGVASVAAGN